VLSLTARHLARAERTPGTGRSGAQPDPRRRLDFKRFIFSCAVERINAGIGRVSTLGANRTRRDSGNDVNDPTPASGSINIVKQSFKSCVKLLFLMVTDEASPQTTAPESGPNQKASAAPDTTIIESAALGLALSGGGVRAALFSLGVVIGLIETGATGGCVAWPRFPAGRS